MGIYVKDIELPKEPDEMIELAIFGDGKTTKTGESWRSPVDGKCYYGPSEDMNTYSALAVSSHGRLIDADALHKLFEDQWHYLQVLDWNENPTAEARQSGVNWCINTMHDSAPTIIEAEEAE